MKSRLGLANILRVFTYVGGQVGTTAHPSLWQVPEDILILRNNSGVPFQIHTAEFDGESLF